MNPVATSIGCANRAGTPDASLPLSKQGSGNIDTGDRPPLCVDLDGTLIDGDTLRIALATLLGRRPWSVWPLTCALLQGRAAFKHMIASRHQLDLRRLPWRPTVLEFLRYNQTAGRRLVLATAAPCGFAEAVAGHLRLFEAVIASGTTTNLKGREKVRAIREFTGGGDFDYAGDSWADLPVFEAARRCIVVTRDPRLLARVRIVGQIETVFPE